MILKGSLSVILYIWKLYYDYTDFCILSLMLSHKIGNSSLVDKTDIKLRNYLLLPSQLP